MKVRFLDKFSKDLDRIQDKTLKGNLIRLIEKAEAADTFDSIPNLKKLSGHKSAYRIRIGDYRAGIFYEEGEVIFARIAHRKDIYKVFP